MNVDAKNVKKVTCTFVTGTLMAIGVMGLMTASAAAVLAQGQSKGVFVSSIVPGIITAISGNHITIRNMDGETYDIIVEPDARLDRLGTPIKLGDVKTGISLGAAGWLDGKTLRAAAVTVGDAESTHILFDKQQKDVAIVGKTFVMGDVMAIDNSKLTVKRTDHVVQVIEVDGNTSLQNEGRGGLTSATLADVKVGGTIIAGGGLKDNVFVAKTIYLIPMH